MTLGSSRASSGEKVVSFVAGVPWSEEAPPEERGLLLDAVGELKSTMAGVVGRSSG